MKNLKLNLLTLTTIIFTGLSAMAQGGLPRTSPNAELKQTIALTDVSLTYSSPSVNNRTVWGELVPYNQVWRAGANEATHITFSRDVKVEGKALKAGSYSLFILPTEKDWTFIFNKVDKQWGAFSYNKTEDALRVTVPFKSTMMNESLVYHFSDVAGESAMLNLTWEQATAGVKIEVNDMELAVKNLNATATKAMEAKDVQTLTQCALWCADFKINLEEAETWITKAVEFGENSFSMWVKARVLAEQGNYKEAIATATKAIELGKKENGGVYTMEGFINAKVKAWEAKIK